MEDEELKKIFGSLLKVGNCLSAGDKQTGSADGFFIEEDLGKISNVKDRDGKTILEMICHMKCDEDAQFISFASKFKEVAICTLKYRLGHLSNQCETHAETFKA